MFNLHINSLSTNTTKQMKQMNIALVKHALKTLSHATKATIARETGLSVATCGTILNELCEQNEVLEQAFEESNGGRPAKRFIYNADYFHILSLYVQEKDQQSFIHSSITSATGSPLSADTVNVSEINLDSLIAFIAEKIQQDKHIQAIGIGLPGVVNDNTVQNCDIPALKNMPIVDLLSQRFGIFVQAGNDANYAAYGFSQNVSLNRNAPIAYLMMQQKNCPGCGIVIDGRVLSGMSQFAGEVSYLPFDEHQTIIEQLPNEQSELIKISTHIICSLVAIINPQTIAITGDLIPEECLATLYQKCSERIPPKHMPKLVYRKNIHDDYMQGLSAMTLENLNYHRMLS